MNIKYSKDSSMCFVIANGPSFRDAWEGYQNEISNSDCLVSNTFALSDHFFTLRPKYYVWFDKFLWEVDTPTNRETIETLAYKVDWKIYFFVPIYGLKTVRKSIIRDNKFIEIIPYNYNYYRGLNWIGNILMKKKLMSIKSSTVTATSLFLAINLGYEKIILVGADQRWHENVDVTQENVLCTRVVHFYENEKNIELVPFYKGGVKENGLYSVSDFFKIQYETFKSYEDVAAYANWMKACIYNSSISSFIDVFPKISIKSAILNK